MQETIPVTYIISGKPTQISTKLSYEWDDEEDYICKLELVVTIEGVTYKVNGFAHALRKLLLQHIKIVCCGSCRHGNYCPYGDNENEIFCFKDKVFEKKFDICDEFTNEKEYWTTSPLIMTAITHTTIGDYINQFSNLTYHLQLTYCILKLIDINSYKA